MRVLKYRKTAGKRLSARHAENASRMKLNVSKGDTVRVMRGDDKGREGKVIRVFLKTGRVLVITRQIASFSRKAENKPEAGRRQAGRRAAKAAKTPVRRFSRSTPAGICRCRRRASAFSTSRPFVTG